MDFNMVYPHFKTFYSKTVKCMVFTSKNYELTQFTVKINKTTFPEVHI